LSGEAVATWYAVAGPNGDTTWRVQSPARAIGAKAVLIPDGIGFKQLTYPNLDGEFPWVMDVTMEDGTHDRITSEWQWKAMAEQGARITERKADYLAQEGSSAVFTRPLAYSAAHMIEMRNEYGIRVLAETDDNYLSDAKLNYFLNKMGWGENQKDEHMRSICSSDGIIVSTPYLRDLYHKGLKEQVKRHLPDLWHALGKKAIPEIHVCRNHIDEQYIPQELSPPRDDGRLRIGYMGSDSHIWDVWLIHDALLEAHLNGHEIVFIGISPKDLNPKFTRNKREWQVPYTHIPWRNNDFRGTPLPLDIGLAPIVVDHHTLGKSDIKWLEYGLSGAASVLQNCLVYNQTAVHGETALLANGPAEFALRMRELIHSPELRERLTKNTMQYINEERLLSKNAEEWRSVVVG
jgi:hypothetical protein